MSFGDGQPLFGLDGASAVRVAARYKSKSKDSEGNVHYEYSERQVQHRNREKAKRVEKLRKGMTNLREKVVKDIKSDDPKTALAALAVALMDETCERVGNDESASDGHFGVTGWEKKHLTFRGGKATLKYVGKSGVEHEKTVSKAPVVKALRELARGKGKNDRLLERDGVSVNSGDVNAYLKPFDVTAKDIRGFRANDAMVKALRRVRREGPKLPWARKEKDKILKDEFKEALEEVADMVGHEASTLRSQYLVPKLEDMYMKDGTVLSSFKTATKSESEKEDEAVEDMIKPEPKKKPPRTDLRKRRLDVKDSDLDGEDDDLSLNYKKVGSPTDSTVRVAMAIRVAARVLAKVSGDEDFEKWVKGRTFKNPDPKARKTEVQFSSLPEEEQARIREEWEDEKDGHPKPKSPRLKDPKNVLEQDTKTELQERARSLKDAPAFSEDVSRTVDDALEFILEEMDASEAEAFVGSIVESRDAGIDSVIRERGALPKAPSKEKIEDLRSKVKDTRRRVETLREALEDADAETASEIKKRLGDVEQKLGGLEKELQDGFAKFYAKEAIAHAVRNPMTWIQDSTPLAESKVRDRIGESASRYRTMSSEDRRAAAKSFDSLTQEAGSRLDEIEEQLRSDSVTEDRAALSRERENLLNRLEYLEADRRGLEISAIAEGDKDFSSSIPEASRALIKALNDSDVDVSDMIRVGLGVTGSAPDTEVVEGLIKKVHPDHLEEALRAMDPSGKIADAFKKAWSGDEDDSHSYVWPISAIKRKQERERAQNAHAIVVDLLTGVVQQETLPDETRQPRREDTKSPKKKRPRVSPDQDVEERRPSEVYESEFAESIKDLVELDISDG